MDPYIREFVAKVVEHLVVPSNGQHNPKRFDLEIFISHNPKRFDL